MDNKDVLKLIKDEEADYVDIRFTDPRGKLQHARRGVRARLFGGHRFEEHRRAHS